MDDTIGVDISKPTLDAFRLRMREHRQFPNDRAGCAALIRWIGASAVRVVFEPTGPYHRLFEASLVAAGIEAVKVNPRSSRRFAEATGELAKTDRIDAAILARMGAVLDLEGRPAKTETLHDLREMGVARQALVKDRIAATNREQIAVNPVIKRQLRARLKQIGIQLKEIDAAIATLVGADPGLSRRRDVLASIPGIGTVTAMSILIEMPELGTLDNKQAASLAGLAPMTRQSGTWSGRARIRGGRRSLRTALYMPALVALRFNPDLKQKYQALKDAGKPSKVAITAIMRKLLVLANALLRDDRKWNAKAA
ncbi:IS110 family transposase [Paracoccus sp. (in: a-proteobacteria)]|uniref:IS110 family transposase n=1 Tax=Paracoccus sp. TaxID=267 RepID=UPI002AFE2ECF|nr:IS110 family transposase [Paracoccus sp. (in: a-proteobacteria)]